MKVKIKNEILIGLGILLLLSGCLAGGNVEEKIEVPVSGAPYSYQELSSITLRFPMKVIKDEKLSNISDTALEKIAPEIKTFTGEKYVKFQPILKLTNENEDVIEFLFKGEGYVDNINFDQYEIYIYYDNRTGQVEFDQKNFGWWGVPTKHKIIAEEIARKKIGIDEKVWPLIYLTWDPNSYGRIEMKFGTELVAVDLERGEVVE